MTIKTICKEINPIIKIGNIWFILFGFKEYEDLIECYRSPLGVNKSLLLATNILLEECENVTVEEAFNILNKFEENTEDILRLFIIKKINRYDSSDSVNTFYINGEAVWFSKDIRVGLVNSINIEKNSGKSDTILWCNDNSYSINVDRALDLLYQLELYAIECYNVTHNKLIEVSIMSESELKNIDIESNYPEKLSFEL